MSIDSNIYLVKKDGQAIPYANIMLVLFEALKQIGAFSYVNVLGKRAIDFHLHSRFTQDAVFSTMPIVYEHKDGKHTYPNLIGGGTFDERSLSIGYGEYTHEGIGRNTPESLTRAKGFMTLKLTSDSVAIDLFNKLGAKLSELLPEFEVFMEERDDVNQYKFFADAM